MMQHSFLTGTRVFLNLALAVVLGAASQARAADGRPSCHVLAVGINHYRALSVPDLNGCVNDACYAAEQLANQQGGLFDNVYTRTVLDRAATRANIEQELDRVAARGQAGDWYVLLLSGHGDQRGAGWFFLPTDYDPNQKVATSVADARIISWAERLMQQGKQVVLIVDACHAGGLRHSARGLLSRRPVPGHGGLILMVSSMASQTSADLGAYSAFARAVGEALSGKADLDGDGFVTLQEVRRYAHDRVHELTRGTRQDGECDHSLALSDSVRLAVVRPVRAPR
jgi:hypothetical protein